MENISLNIIKSLARGDIAGYEWLFNRYYDKVFTFTLKITRNEWVSEEVAQNVFLKVWLGRENLPKVKSLSSYLFAIARNEATDHFRHMKVRGAYCEQGDLERNPGGEDAVIEKLDSQMMQEMIDRCVEKMPPQRRRVFIMNKRENKTSEEISQLMGISKRTVDKHLQLAMEELKKLLAILAIIFLR